MRVSQWFHQIVGCTCQAGIQLKRRPVAAACRRASGVPVTVVESGASVLSGSTKIGVVVDFSGVERQALAQYTNDAGNHVSLEVHPAATLALP